MAAAVPRADLLLVEAAQEEVETPMALVETAILAAAEVETALLPLRRAMVALEL